MRSFYKLLLSGLFGLSASICYAQTDTTFTDTLNNSKAGLHVGVTYTNNSVYLGRTDTVTAAIISPTIGYTFKMGLYLSGSLEVIPNRRSNKLDGGDIEIGYDHNFTDNFEGGVSFTKLFYNNNSTQVSSSLSSVINAYADYDIADVITPALVVSYNMNKNSVGNDLLINPNLSHDFEIDGIFGSRDHLVISPQAGLNAGSQNYYAGYLEKKNRISKKVTAAVNASIDSYYAALSDFKLLDYEITVPIVYKLSNFSISLTPTYAFAQDSLPKDTKAHETITKNIETGSPYRSSVFYFSAGISFKF